MKATAVETLTVNDELEVFAAARASVHERIRRLNLGEAMRWPVIEE